ncbi:2-oxo-4-hydroxy-4-carboxy-5-ureidoimidazoline decarboxylase [Marinomonas pollencensis]|uniref:2-oxo-4-hydroxy-4-carboxy-5-ureidoimidazoline decarboxylase n=1 Tax=Marinomonas pollencensis TaxID=491954 RepID=A0A3E0DKP1_9GAMM|nr:2-oxo-4-hydroxy-4-carboxy-5-ureidoimidazoline decarboxylase [Marinomonas pollencensis]REG83267.1 OHCU decarboxylase [Marinomonas pollencensis]
MGSDMGWLLNKPSEMSKQDFIAHFKDIYEHSEWVAQAAWLVVHAQQEKFDRREALQSLLKSLVDDSDHERKLTLLRLHPDLAGKAALSGQLTHASTSEQAGAGLDQCTAQELARFAEYNNAYKSKYGFPFIMAVKGATKFDILAGFESRLNNSVEQEFQMALSQVHKIAGFRLADK